MNIDRTTQFKRDINRAKKQRKDFSELKSVIKKLAQGKPLPEKHKDHRLYGKLRNYRECHITPDWLLMYKIEKDTLVLVRICSHAELFK